MMTSKVPPKIQGLLQRQIRKILVPKSNDLPLRYEQRKLILPLLC
jgi:hypothetical protein